MDPFSVYNHKFTNIIIENKLGFKKNLSSFKLYHSKNRPKVRKFF